MKKPNKPTPRPIKAFAIVNIKNPKISAMEIYEDKDVHFDKGEEIIRVTINPCK